MTSVEEEKLINFGTRCPDCRKENNEIRCLKCFTFDCLLCKEKCVYCDRCYCKLIEGIFKERLSEARSALREKIRSRLPIESKIETVSTHTYKLHNGNHDLNLIITLCKTLETSLSNTPKEQLNQGENRMTVFVNRNKVHVLLKDTIDQKVVAVCGKDRTERHDRFVRDANCQLENLDMKLHMVYDFEESLNKDKDQIIVICHVSTRLTADVKYALTGIDEKYYKQIILVLLHFKKEDKKESATELRSEGRFSDMTIIDYFQQTDMDNIQDVSNKISEAVNSYKY